MVPIRKKARHQNIALKITTEKSATSIPVLVNHPVAFLSGLTAGTSMPI